MSETPETLSQKHELLTMHDAAVAIRLEKEAAEATKPLVDQVWAELVAANNMSGRAVINDQQMSLLVDGVRSLNRQQYIDSVYSGEKYHPFVGPSVLAVVNDGMPGLRHLFELGSEAAEQLDSPEQPQITVFGKTWDRYLAAIYMPGVVFDAYGEMVTGSFHSNARIVQGRVMERAGDRVVNRVTGLLVRVTGEDGTIWVNKSHLPIADILERVEPLTDLELENVRNFSGQ